MGGIAGIHLNKREQNCKDILFRMLNEIQHRAPLTKVNDRFESVCMGVQYHFPDQSTEAMAFELTEKILVIIDGDIFVCRNETLSQKEPLPDAQLVLKAYQLYKEDFVDKIDGNYSIAIWDQKEDKLILVRDRVGAKPLFYSNTKLGFTFASEIKSILKSGLCDRDVNLSAIDSFLSYWYVPNPVTLLKSVFQVKPGHLLIYKNNTLTEKQYWKFQYQKDYPEREEEYYKEQFKEVFSRSVSRIVKKYPKCGAFLSGGLDSSSVVAAMCQFKSEPFDVFSAGFKEEQYNEIGDAQVVADHFGINHHYSILEFDQDFTQLLEKLVWYHDGPFCDTSAIPSYYVAKLAKSHTDVVLTGDFPDQLIGGSGYQASCLERQSSDTWLDRILRQSLINGFARSIPMAAGRATLSDKLKRTLYRRTFPIEMQRIIANMPVPELLKPCLYSKPFYRIHQQNNPLSYAEGLYDEVKDCDLLDKLLYFDILSYATDDLMVKVDRTSMANGLIAISPFHDQELVEFVTRLPSSMKIKGKNRKYIMREAFKNILPDHTINKKKKGFDMPIENWLIQKYNSFVKDVLFDSKTLNRGYFDKSFMQEMVNNFLKRKTDYASGSAATIISLITLELWHRLFIDC